VGYPLSRSFQTILQWCGADDSEIGRITLECFAQTDEDIRTKLQSKPKEVTFKPISVPGKPILKWFNSTNNNTKLNRCLEYIGERHLLHQVDQIYWSPESEYNEKIIIPFVYKGIQVGFSARTINDRKFGKYITQSQPGYVYGIDQQTPKARFAILCEGLLDALSLNAISPLNNFCSDEQIDLIEGIHREIILVPDRDKAGVDLIKVALRQKWAVSFPEWGPNIKDINDAVKKYGTLFTMKTIIDAKETSALKIEMSVREWCKTKLSE
jgi:hypothetical protein